MADGTWPCCQYQRASHILNDTVDVRARVGPICSRDQNCWSSASQDDRLPDAFLLQERRGWRLQWSLLAGNLLPLSCSPAQSGAAVALCERRLAKQSWTTETGSWETSCKPQLTWKVKEIRADSVYEAEGGAPIPSNESYYNSLKTTGLHCEVKRVKEKVRRSTKLLPNVGREWRMLRSDNNIGTVCCRLL